MSATVALESGMIVDLSSLVTKVSDDEFAEFCRRNPEMRVERTSEGDLVIMPPTGGETGGQNFYLIGKFFVWVEVDGTGKGFDSSTIFSLPNGARRSPDLSWVRYSRWNSLTARERKGFPPLCPDFVVEIRSETDSIRKLQAKLEEYIDSGAELGWLLDPIERRVYVYQPGVPVVVLDDPQSVSGDSLLKGFVLDLRSIWG